MGIKDLFNLMCENNVLEVVHNLPSNAHYFVDFNSFFYAAMYHITLDVEVEMFPDIVADKLSAYLTPRTVYCIDSGRIKMKDEERTVRRSKKIRPIDQIILDNRVKFEKEIFRILNIKNITSHKYSDDHDKFVSSLNNMTESIAVYTEQFDAEYGMVVFGSRIDSDVVYVSNDQDMIALVSINSPQSVMIYNNKILQASSFRIKEDLASQLTAKLITFTALICNKSDYFSGLEQISAGTFLRNNSYPFDFSIRAQSTSNEILPANEQLLNSLIDAIKIENRKPQYRLDGIFTPLFKNYIQNICKFLTLNTEFFT